MTMLQAALAAAAAGLPVFPCHPNDKQPLTASRVKGEGGVKQATTDLVTIREWWRHWPDAMIGMRCGTRESGGAGIFVVDIDPKEGATAESVLTRLRFYLAERIAGEGVDSHQVADLAASVERAGKFELVAPVMVRTPRGGLHLWYRAPDGLNIGNRGNLLKGKIEQIDVRGASFDDGAFKPGYVIIPPSVRRGGKAAAEGCDGKAYEFVRGSLAELCEAQPEMLELVRERVREAAPGRTYSPAEALAAFNADDARQAAIRKHVEAALAGELERARSRKGNRNNDLNAAAVSLGKLIPGGFLDEGVVRGLLEQEAINNGLAKDDGLQNVRKTITSGLEHGKRHPRDLAEVGNLAGRRTRPPPITAAVHSENPSFDIGDDADHVHAPARSPQPLAEDDSDWPADYPQAYHSAEDGDDDPPPPDDPPGGGGEGQRPSGFDPAKLAEAAKEKLNDYGNCRRLLIWHGEDFLNVNVSDALGNSFGVHTWRGTRWHDVGASYEVMRMAHRVGPFIELEADLLQPTGAEAADMDAGDAAAHRLKIRMADLDAMVNEDAAKSIRTEIAALKQDMVRGNLARSALGARRAARRKFGLSTGNQSRCEAMVKQAIAYCTYEPSEMNRDPTLINCRNGTLHLVETSDGWTVELRAHQRAEKITKLMKVDYDPEATAPLWQKFIELVQPNPDNRAFLQTWHGLALTGLTEQAFVLNYGTGANGKTTFIETIARMQGDYAQTLPAEALVGDNQRRGDQATPDLARLAGARLVRVAELPRGHGFRESVLKLLTGGDAVPVRQLHGRFWDLEPAFKAVGVCNEKPDISGVDEGIWRRVKLVNWNVAIPLEERRPIDDVFAEFKQERPGILNWLVAGLISYMNAGRLIVPQDVLEATESYREDMDPVGAFKITCVRKAPTKHVTAFEMYRAFQAYCHANSLRVMSQKNFTVILTSKGITRHKHNGTIQYDDVELHDVPIDPTPNQDGKWATNARYRGRNPYGTEPRELPPDDELRPSDPPPQPIGPGMRPDATDD
jgi:putative DNA primase/helicase